MPSGRRLHPSGGTAAEARDRGAAAHAAQVGIQIPDDETAGRCLLHHMATRLSAGAVSPREAAAPFWQGTVPLTNPERAFVQAVGQENYLDHLSTEDLRSWENALRPPDGRSSGRDNLSARTVTPAKALPATQRQFHSHQRNDVQYSSCILLSVLVRAAFLNVLG